MIVLSKSTYDELLRVLNVMITSKHEYLRFGIELLSENTRVSVKSTLF